MKFILILWLSISSLLVNAQQTLSWKGAQVQKKAKVDVFWFDSEPFIYYDSEGKLKGIEYDIIENFVVYLKQTQNFELEVNWVRANSFPDVINNIRDEIRPNVFGCSALSITKQRKKIVRFSSSYLEEITIIISNRNVPIVANETEFKEVFSELTAITIKKTSFEHDLFDLKEKFDLNFDIQYISGEENILKTIAQKNNTFGYTDLSIYLTNLKNNPNYHVIRQSVFPIKQDGYGFIMPKNSDWVEPFNHFLNSVYFRDLAPSLIEKYIPNDIYNLVKRISSGENLNPDEEILLLTKEKEINYRDLMEAALREQKSNWIIYISVAGLIVAFLAIVVLFMFYKSKAKSNKELTVYKTQIEQQRADIQDQSEALEARNNELIALNEEKNNLIYVLAHDLRSPINQIAGLVHLYLMEHKNLNKEDQFTFDTIINGTKHLNEMISKILDVDAIETDQLNIKKELIDVGEVLGEVMEEFKEVAETKNINLLLKYDRAATVLADRVYLRQIMDNLVSNALKFSYSGTDVLLNTSIDEDSVIIEVKDQGPGFTAHDKKKMFQKFQRLSAKPTAGEQSTGLGLSIVRKYVELMGANITCQSDMGKGSNFVIRFPKPQ